MRLRGVWVAVGVGICVYGAAATSACTGDDPTSVPTAADDGSAEGASGGLKASGAACMQGSECSTGSCADGVCCDTACTGVCESCNQGGSTGKCLPIAAGTDPDGECKPLALTTDDAGTGDDGGGDGGTLNLPEAGVSGMETPCAGSCNGMRACAYPGSATTCGTKFCNDSTTLGRLACNGGGHCADLTFDACQGYVCKDGASAPDCAKTCAAAADCDETHYCDGLSSTCKPKKGLGIACTIAGECTSGNCVGGPPGVCCNSICNFSGATCATGTCRCSACGSDPTGTCLLFYRDSDGDTYGDLNVTTIGCDKSPPSGYVLDHTDCDDGNNLVHPGAGFQPSAIIGGPKAGTFDYDCDGKETKQTPDNLGGTTCGYCGFVNVGGLETCERSSSTCGAANRAGTLNCAFQSCGPLGQACCTGYGYGFPGTVACGTTSTQYTCLPCAAAGGTSGVTTVPNVTQQCR